MKRSDAEIPALKEDGMPQPSRILEGDVACVLIVDDNPAKLTSLAAIVSGMKLDVVTANSGREALRHLLNQDFAVILLDVRMPIMDGYETAQIIRSRMRSAHTPIIFITSEALTEEECYKGYSAGAVDWILSPVIPEILKAKIKVFVDLYYVNRIVQSQTEELQKLYDELEQKVIERTKKLGLFRRIFDSVNEGIMVLDDKNILFVNPSFSRITGYSADEVVGKNPRKLSTDFLGEEAYNKILESIWHTGYWFGETRGWRKNGECYDELLSISRMKSEHDEVNHYIVVFSDISKLKEAEKRIAYMAQHDILTDLPNRMLLFDRLSQGLANAERKQRMVAVLFLDLDNFKNINDTLGHDIGDKLLQVVAKRIKDVVRTTDTVSRQGGDEFIIVLFDPGTVEQVNLIADKLLSVLATPVVLDGNEIQVTTSIGVSMFPDNGADSHSLIKHADMAMYQAKQKGRNTIQFFTEEMHRRMYERLSLRAKLIHALDSQELFLHYQPQINIEQGCIIGAEALIRWHHPELGIIPPVHFIPIAEESGLIGRLSEWVMQEAFSQNKKWRKMGFPEITIAVNISQMQFHTKNLDKIILGILEKSGLPPSAIDLEINEGTFIHDAAAAIEMLQKLKQHGIKISMDDFGTGYSNLSYLKKFPIDKLKIDRSFVQNMMKDEDDEMIVNTIINMTSNLGVKVIAEGVESQDQINFLKQRGCMYFQGNYFSKPVSAAEFSRLLQKGLRKSQV